MAKLTKQVQQELAMDMTPMIDCVFLLMIFFVLVIDLSQNELEDLILPAAEYAVADEDPPETRPVINIMQDGRMIFKGTTFYDPAEHGDNYTTLRPMFTEWRDHIAQEENIKKKTVGGGMTMTVIEEPVLVRADKWTEWHFVGKFMEACTNPEAAYPQLELALSEQDKEEKMLKGRGQ
ncbi:MAG: biopolymer transporter ExbD [Planctomycetota bacterium]